MNKYFLKTIFLISIFFLITIIASNSVIVKAVNCQQECEMGFYMQYGRNPDLNNTDDKKIIDDCLAECQKSLEEMGVGETGNTEGEEGLVIENPLNPISDIWQLILRIINIALNIAIYVCVILIVWAGFLWITSAGNEEKIKQAQKTLIWALVGLGVALIASGVPPLIYELITGKKWEDLYNKESSSVENSSFSSNSLEENYYYPQNLPQGAIVFKNGQCFFDDNATPPDDPRCVDDLT